MKKMMKDIISAVLCVSIAFAGSLTFAEEEPKSDEKTFKESAKEFGGAVKDFGKKIGSTAKTAGKKIGEGAKKAGKKISDTAEYTYVGKTTGILTIEGEEFYLCAENGIKYKMNSNSEKKREKLSELNGKRVTVAGKFDNLEQTAAYTSCKLAKDSE